MVSDKIEFEGRLFFFDDDFGQVEMIVDDLTSQHDPEFRWKVPNIGGCRVKVTIEIISKIRI